MASESLSRMDCPCPKSGGVSAGGGSIWRNVSKYTIVRGFEESIGHVDTVHVFHIQYRFENDEYSPSSWNCHPKMSGVCRIAGVAEAFSGYLARYLLQLTGEDFKPALLDRCGGMLPR